MKALLLALACVAAWAPALAVAAFFVAPLLLIVVALGCLGLCLLGAALAEAASW